MSVFKKILLSVMLIGTLVPNAAMAKDVDNFYFDDFTADYYLSMDSEGISHLKVKESFTIIFPNFDQNKGVCRHVPYTNQGGENITLDRPTTSSLNLRRNGFYEPVYSIDRDDGYYTICTGDESYIKGRQTYTMELNFYKVVTKSEDRQAIVWDTNGTGAKQRFNSVTARVHFADEATKNAYDGEEWCYVGKYGTSGQGRCTIKKIEDGIEFSTKGVLAYENMSFDIRLKADSFVVPESPVRYGPIIIMTIFIAISILIIVLGIRKYNKKGELRRYYKGLFVTPEYAPPKGFDIAPLSEIYIGKKKNVNVAILLKLITEKRVELVKTDKTKLFGGTIWALKIVDVGDLFDEERITLKLLNGGTEIKNGDKIEIKSQRATSSTIALGKKFDSSVKEKLKKYGWIEHKYKVGRSGTSGLFSAIFVVILLGLTYGLPLFFFAFMVGRSFYEGTRAFGKDYFVAVSLGSLLIAITVRLVLSSHNKKYENYTKEGLRMSRYMDGLKLYIKMAEEDRIKFLQSMENVDISNEGIVKLHEKLLPYAAVFGLEKSWMKELEKYYSIEGVKEPDWYRADIGSVATFHAISTASSYVGHASMSAGSGSSSSGHYSGGSGGGFSGGGGGGGGFSGR